MDLHSFGFSEIGFVLQKKGAICRDSSTIVEAISSRVLSIAYCVSIIHELTRIFVTLYITLF